MLLRESENSKGVLANFRTDLNEASNKISLLLADRYTLEESEKKVDSEYWLQLTPEALEPLDFASTKSAITRRSLFRFLEPEEGYPESVEYYFSCPYCWERISVVLDTSVKRQTYVEDCEVCCQPIQVRYSVAEGDVADFEAKIS